MKLFVVLIILALVSACTPDAQPELGDSVNTGDTSSFQNRTNGSSKDKNSECPAGMVITDSGNCSQAIETNEALEKIIASPPLPPEQEGGLQDERQDNSIPYVPEEKSQDEVPPVPNSLFPGLDPADAEEYSLGDFPAPFNTESDGSDYVFVWASGSAGAACQINLDGVLGSMKAERVFEEQLIEKWDKIKGDNLVIIGNSCNNRLTKEIFGNPDPCDDGLVEGRGYVRLVLYDGEHYALLIMGKTNSDIVDACKFIGAAELEGDEDSFDLQS